MTYERSHLAPEGPVWLWAPWALGVGERGLGQRAACAAMWAGGAGNLLSAIFAKWR